MNYASYDDGKTWVVHGRLPDASNVMSLIQISNGNLIAGAYPGGIMYRNQNNAQGWQRSGSLQPCTSDPRIFVFDLAEIDVGTGHRIIAGTGPAGSLYMSMPWVYNDPPQPAGRGGDSRCFIRSLMPERER